MIGQVHERAPHVSFDEIDYSDTEALKLAQDSMLKEQHVKAAMLKYVRRALEGCFKTSGPNHFEDCREIRERYMNLLPESIIQGYQGYQKTDPSK